MKAYFLKLKQVLRIWILIPTDTKLFGLKDRDSKLLVSDPFKIIRVSDPHPLQADPDPKVELFLNRDSDPGCQIFAVPDPRLIDSKNRCFNVKRRKKNFVSKIKGRSGYSSRDSKNADPLPI